MYTIWLQNYNKIATYANFQAEKISYYKENTAKGAP